MFAAIADQSDLRLSVKSLAIRTAEETALSNENWTRLYASATATGATPASFKATIQEHRLDLRNDPQVTDHLDDISRDAGVSGAIRAFAQTGSEALRAGKTWPESY